MWIYIAGIAVLLILIGISIGMFFLSRWIFDRIIDFVTYNKLPWSDFVFDHYMAFFHYFKADAGVQESYKKTFLKSAENPEKFYPKLSEFDLKTIKGIYGSITEIMIFWKTDPKSEEARRKFELTVETLKNYIAARQMKNYDEAVIEEYKGAFINAREPGEIRSCLLKVSSMIADLQNNPIDYPLF